MAEKQIGAVSHWFGNVSVAGIQLTDKLVVGDRIHIKGHTTDFEQDVTSMQIDRKEVGEAKGGDNVGIKLDDRARVGDNVYKVA